MKRKSTLVTRELRLSLLVPRSRHLYLRRPSRRQRNDHPSQAMDSLLCKALISMGTHIALTSYPHRPISAGYRRLSLTLPIQ
jgi:hypothetical protein